MKQSQMLSRQLHEITSCLADKHTLIEWKKGSEGVVKRVGRVEAGNIHIQFHLKDSALCGRATDMD